MTRRLTLDEAVERLTSSLDAFEAAVSRRRASEEAIQQLEEDVHLLALDRAKLANELDQLRSRADELRSVNSEVADRLDSAMATIRDVLDANGA